VNQQHPQQHELPMIGGIAAGIRWVEELVSLLSGPLLTIGLGIALVDLLTGDGLLRAFPALLYVWGVCQAVGIDAQLVAAWDRVRMAARRRQWGAVVGYVCLGLALAWVGFLSAQAFGYQQAFGLSEADALQRLGIDAVNWQLQRAVLAVFLVALSGFTRYHAPPKVKQTLEDERAHLARELELEPLRQQLRATKATGIGALARQTLAAVTGHEATPAPKKPPTGPGTPAQSADKGLRNPGQPRPKPRPAPAIRLVTPPGELRNRRPGQSKEADARAVWRPGMGVPELQSAADIARPTAQKYSAKFEAQHAAAGNRQEAAI
jgi:hypothetical protein